MFIMICSPVSLYRSNLFQVTNVKLQINMFKITNLNCDKKKQYDLVTREIPLK